MILQSSGNSPEGCRKLATFHVVAGDNIPGNWPRLTPRPEGALEEHTDFIHPFLSASLRLCVRVFRFLHPNQPLIQGANALSRHCFGQTAYPKPLEIPVILHLVKKQTENKLQQTKNINPTLDLGCSSKSSSFSSSSSTASPPEVNKAYLRLIKANKAKIKIVNFACRAEVLLGRTKAGLPRRSFSEDGSPPTLHLPFFPPLSASHCKASQAIASLLPQGGEGGSATGTKNLKFNTQNSMTLPLVDLFSILSYA